MKSVEENQTKIQDRLQFLGLLGPFIILLTLLCTLLKGSPKSSYLFVMTLLALPVSWKWRMKGFLISSGVLIISFLSFYPFFAPHEKLWQLGACLSLALGLFTTFMGFEEVKLFLSKLALESQSRLDNLIDLDEKFNKAQEVWKYEEAELQNELSKKSEALKRDHHEMASLEKMAGALRSELESLQESNSALLKEVEDKAREISNLEQTTLFAKEQGRQAQLQLAEGQGEREKRLIENVALLKDKIARNEQEVAALNERISENKEEQGLLKEELSQKAEAFKSMQEALRQKVASMQELQDKILLKDQDISHQKDEIKTLFQSINQKEHEVLTLKSALNERDFQIQKLNQNLRDTQQNLSQVRSKIEEKKLELKNNDLKNEQAIANYQNTIRTNEVQIKHLSEHVKGIQEELEQMELNVENLKDDKKELVLQYEQKLQEIEEMHKNEEALVNRQFQELRKLNETRFSLFQASLDKENLKANLAQKIEKPKHWLLQLERIMKGERSKRVDFSALPKELSKELLTLNQTKALYKQLRMQFDEKNDTLEMTRKELYDAETKIDELNKESEQLSLSKSSQESIVEKDLSEKNEEVDSLESEIETLNSLISELLKNEKSENFK
ncbi:MAG: Chromosome partition protein Smc [Chlamydiae bacterium]|nr:Chromosome partition protein Smc [Chlamydiota bacterium]